MITQDIRFSQGSMILLHSFIGKEFKKYKCNPFLFTPSVYGIVGFFIDDKSYVLTNFTEVLDYYGSNEDVAVFKFSEAPEFEIKSHLKDTEMIETPVLTKVAKICVVNEHQKLFKQGAQIYDTYTTRALIFHLEDELELSFEKNIWFSEEITVLRGNDLIKRLSPVSNFIESFNGDYTAECTREVIAITK